MAQLHNTQAANVTGMRFKRRTSPILRRYVQIFIHVVAAKVFLFDKLQLEVPQRDLHSIEVNGFPLRSVCHLKVNGHGCSFGFSVV